MITVQLQEADYLAAIRLHRRSTKKLLWTIGCVLCYIVGAGLYFGFAPAQEMYMVYTLLGIAAFFALFMAWMHFVGIPRNARRRFGQQKDLARQYTISWNDEKLIIDGDDLHAGIPWADFLKWNQDDRLFVLYSSRLLFRMVPKRSFSDQAGSTDFAQLLREKIGPEGSIRKSK